MKRELTFSVICDEDELFVRSALDGNLGRKIVTNKGHVVTVTYVEIVEDGRKANVTIAWEGDNDGLNGAPARSD